MITSTFAKYGIINVVKCAHDVGIGTRSIILGVLHGHLSLVSYGRNNRRLSRLMDLATDGVIKKYLTDVTFPRRRRCQS